MKARKGDFVQCQVDGYSFYSKGSTAYVQEVGKQDSTGNSIIKLNNPMSPLGYTWYLASGFCLIHRDNSQNKQEIKPMAAYEKTKYFGILTLDTEGCSELQLGDRRTNLCDSKSHALRLTQEIMGAGETWIILQTIALLEPEEPKPPIRITEYR